MPKYETVRVYFTDKKLKERFASACFHLGTKMSEVLQELVAEWTEEAEAKIEEERAANAQSLLSPSIPNMINAYLLLTYRGTGAAQLRQLARECQIDEKKLQEAVNGLPVDIDMAGELARILGMSLEEFQALAVASSQKNSTGSNNLPIGIK